MLTVNERPYPFRKNILLGDLAAKIKPNADILVLNGTIGNGKEKLKNGDICYFIKSGEIPSWMDMEENLRARHTRKIQQKLEKAKVGIMGLGGLGSAVAVSLVKIGIGKLIISDYDVVVLSNIHRQHYFINQIGQKKTNALKKNLVNINPYVTVTAIDTKLCAHSIPNVFKGVDVLVECFDDAAMKATAMKTVLTKMRGVRYVGASGLAGLDSGNTITSCKIKPGIYLVGDKKSDDKSSGTLFATRVGIAAHHQAHQVLRLLLHLDD